ncbi:MAG: hypothetical protein EBY40_01130 [Marivivens sp.]|nr:hypothetical protein [Marivivens sp.]NBT49997.1 hypothetical protein [Marivivens sp.]NCW67381.1 hypothetical protein [Marivivens sp.]NDH01711.1 hypothetical protein [Marivivens sp.]
MIDGLNYTDQGWALWNIDAPRPRLDRIRATACKVLGCQEPSWDSQKTTRRGKDMLPRAVVAMVCRLVLQNSWPESASASGYRSHGAVIDPDSQCQELLHSEAGRLLYNAVVERMYLDTLDSYRDLTRASLQGHAGGAA